jgi:hypothetical protein
MTEAVFNSYLRKKFTEHGAFVQRIETSTSRGVPDIALLYKGQTYWFECKVNYPILRPEQYVWGRKAMEHQIPHYCICLFKNDEIGLFTCEHTITLTKGIKLSNPIILTHKSNFANIIEKSLM